MSRTQREVEREMVNASIRRGVGSYIGAGSVMREMHGVGAYQVAELEAFSEANQRNSRISEASGPALDAHGRDLRVPRRDVSRAYCLRSDQNIRIFTLDGTTAFNDLPGGGPSIAIGDRLTSADGTATYLITEMPGSLTGLTEAFVGVRALTPGARGNSKPNQIVSHPYRAYQSSVGVNNKFALYNGQEREGDEDYRARLLNAFVALESCNNNAVRREMGMFAGVGKFNIVNSYNGAGTIGVIVQPTLGIANTESTLQGIRARLSQVMPNSGTVVVKSPLLKQIAIESTLRTSEPLNTTEKAAVTNRVNRALLSYFNSLSIGAEVEMYLVEQAIRGADSRIVSLGDNEDTLNVVKYIVGDDYSSYEVVLNRDERFISIDVDELAVLATTNPVTITIV